jgi:hypothetical protein
MNKIKLEELYILRVLRWKPNDITEENVTSIFRVKE